MALNAVRTADDQQRVIQHLHRAFCLRRKINMSGCIQERENGIPEGQRGLMRKDRDAAAALDLICIKPRITVIDSSALPDLAGTEKQRLCKRRLSGIDMRHNADSQLFHPVHPCASVFCIPAYFSKPSSAARRISSIA